MSILKFYEKNLDRFWLRAIIPGLLAAVALFAKFVDRLWYIPIAVLATLAIPIHTYLISKSSEAKLNEVTYWKFELELHRWLLNVIRGMLLKKMDRFRKQTVSSSVEEYSQAVMANLVALREFYASYDHDPQNHFRITYFRPSDDGQYLTTKFYANADGTPPVSHGDIEAQKKYFNRDTSPTLAVAAWKHRDIHVAEKESEITYMTSQQKDKYKSIIACPIFENNDTAKSVIGIITITSRKEFFKRHDIERHKNYMEQFALRLVFEHCKLQSNNSGARPA
ncbi:MAG TPA: hypothetical protein VF903_07410 [Nitrospirota bacterium]